MADDLKALRKRLDQLDAELIDLVAQRQATVAAIGQLKHRQGRHLRDFEREREVLDLAHQRGQEKGLPAGLSHGLMSLLIEHSLGSQERGSLARSAVGEGRRALVIGGLGRMGRWFADFLSIQSYQVIIVDTAASAEHKSTPYTLEPDWRPWVAEVDMIVVATPMAATATILNELANYDTEAIIFDVGSLKSPLLPGLVRLAEQKKSVVSVHPMFGPDCNMLSGKHVVLVDLGHQAALQQVSMLFEKTMANVVVLAPEIHDRLMAYVLSLSHLFNIAFATVLANSGEEALRLRHISSTSFEAQLGVARRIANENPEVYYEIQSLNPHAAMIRKELKRTLNQIDAIIEKNDLHSFSQLMTTNQSYLERVNRAPSVGDEAKPSLCLFFDLCLLSYLAVELGLSNLVFKMSQLNFR
mgnify:CR=1 FL=1